MESNKKTFFNFAQKLQKILQDPSLSQIVVRNANSSYIEIFNEEAFVKQVLPIYFKHSKLASFFRQLHLYGFKKIKKSNYHIFSNEKLQKGVRVSELINTKKQKKLLKIKLRKLKNLQKEKKKVESMLMENNFIPQQLQKNGSQQQFVIQQKEPQYSMNPMPQSLYKNSFSTFYGYTMVPLYNSNSYWLPFGSFHT